MQISVYCPVSSLCWIFASKSIFVHFNYQSFNDAVFSLVFPVSDSVCSLSTVDISLL